MEESENPSWVRAPPEDTVAKNNFVSAWQGLPPASSPQTKFDTTCVGTETQGTCRADDPNFGEAFCASIKNRGCCLLVTKWPDRNEAGADIHSLHTDVYGPYYPALCKFDMAESPMACVGYVNDDAQLCSEWDTESDCTNPSDSAQHKNKCDFSKLYSSSRRSEIIFFFFAWVLQNNNSGNKVQTNSIHFFCFAF